MSRVVAALCVIGPAGILAAALISQYVGGLTPCEMCLWQRWPHAIATALASAAFLIGAGIAARALHGIGALVLLAGVGIAIAHVGVEQGWWEGFTACAAGAPQGATTEDLIAAIMAAPVVRCDDVQWSLAGISMAGWNGILSTGLAALFALAALRGGQASSSASQ